MNIKWDAGKYSNEFQFVHKYGEDVMGLLQSEAGSRVIDLGCGNGNLTAKLRARGFDVLGIDDSEDMLLAARNMHPDITFRKGNALTFKTEPADAVFSNAVLHWINRELQPALLSNIAANLKKGGEFVCEFGGYGCAETVHAGLKEIFLARGYQYTKDFFFPTIGEYAPLLEQAGLKVTFATLFDRPTRQEKGLRDWIQMFNMAPFSGIPEQETESIMDEAEQNLAGVLCRDGIWYVDYVRIRFRCVKV